MKQHGITSSNMGKTFGARALAFYQGLVAPAHAILGTLEPVLPFPNPEARRCTRAFYEKFFSDDNPRVFVLGINPGRFGSGVTGIPFTDAVALGVVCGIPNAIAKRREMSSTFVHRVIETMGGPEEFYRRFFLSAVSPIGFVKEGRNFNYYDDPHVLERLQPFITETMTQQLAFGARRDVAILLGSGRNHRVFETLNREHQWFSRVYALEHPRYVMQYRGKDVQTFIMKYRDTLLAALGEEADP